MSGQDATILKCLDAFCRRAPEMGDTTMDRLVDVIQTVSFDLNVFKGRMQHARDNGELAQREWEQTIITNGFEKRTLKKGVGGPRKSDLLHRDV